MLIVFLYGCISDFELLKVIRAILYGFNYVDGPTVHKPSEMRRVIVSLG